MRPHTFTRILVALVNLWFFYENIDYYINYNNLNMGKNQTFDAVDISTQIVSPSIQYSIIPWWLIAYSVWIKMYTLMMSDSP